jgi:hypothetical protein
MDRLAWLGVWAVETNQGGHAIQTVMLRSPGNLAIDIRLDLPAQSAYAAESEVPGRTVRPACRFLDPNRLRMSKRLSLGPARSFLDPNGLYSVDTILARF